jgi:hypothetical protein
MIYSLLKHNHLFINIKYLGMFVKNGVFAVGRLHGK